MAARRSLPALGLLQSLGLPAGLLIYASDRPLERHVVERAGTSLEIVSVEMAGSPRSLEARMREAAGRLVQQAAHQRARYKVAG